MSALRVRLMCAVAVICCSAGSVLAMSLEEALGRLKTYRFGRENEAVKTIQEAAVGSFNDPATRRKLLAGLSDMPTPSKAWLIRAMAGRRESGMAAALVKACSSATRFAGCLLP